MTATIERAKADDPRELKKRIVELERQLAKAQEVTVSSTPQPVLTDTDRALLADLSNRIDAAARRFAAPVLDVGRIQAALATVLSEATAVQAAAVEELGRLLETNPLQAVIGRLNRVAVNNSRIISTPNRTSPVASRPAQAHPKPAPIRQASGPGEAMPPGEKAVLTASAMYQDGVTRDQLGVLTGYKRSSRDAYIARLATKGWVSSANGHVVATPAGIDALGSDFEPLPTGAALLDWWRARLPKGERDVLDVLVAAQGNGVRREAIDGETGFKRSSRDAYLARLASRRLVQSAGPGMVRASWELFG